MAGVGRVDELVKDYLFFRGLHATRKAFESELKGDKDNKFRADMIVDQLMAYVTAFDLASLREYWSYLDMRLFSRLEQVYSSCVRKLEVSLLKLYLATCIHSNKPDRVTEFFERLSGELQHQAEWKDWFLLPFIKNPEENSQFAMYFTRQWQDTFLLSLHNFLSVISESMSTPALLSYEDDQRKIAQLQEENESLKAQLQHNSASNQHHAQPSEPSTPCASVDLMDDFFVISQSAADNQDQPGKIRSFIKSMTLPSSPVLGKKQMPAAEVTPPSCRTSSLHPHPSKPTHESNKTPHHRSPSVTRTHTSNLAPCVCVTSTSSGSAQPTNNDVIDITLKLPDHVSPINKQSEHSTALPSVAQLTSNKAEDDLKTTYQTSSDGVDSFTAGNTSEFKTTASSSPSQQMSDDCAADRELLLLGQEEYCEHHAAITQARFNHCSDAIATTDVDGVVKVWGVTPSPCTLATVMSKSTLLSFDWLARSDHLMLLGNKMAQVRLFNTRDKQTVKECVVDAQYPRLCYVRCSPTGNCFTCCSSGRLQGGTEGAVARRLGSLSLWDLETMTLTHSLSSEQQSVATNYVAYNSSGSLLMAGDTDGSIRVYDTTSATCLNSWAAHAGEVHTVSFSQDDASAYSMGADGKLISWSMVQMGQKLASLPIHSGAAGPFVLQRGGGYRQVHTAKGSLFSLAPDSPHILTCCGNSGVIYSLSGESSLQTCLSVSKHTTPVTTVDWGHSDHGKLCLTGAMDGTVTLSTLMPK